MFTLKITKLQMNEFILNKMSFYFDKESLAATK